MTSSLEVLYQDGYIVAVDKPAWWVVHRTRGARDAEVVVQTLRRQLGGEVYPVHRLDRQASGVLVLARTREAASVIGRQLREAPGTWHKRYLGLCRGVLERGCTVDHPVRGPGGVRREAQTHLDPLEVYCQRYTLVRATPVTGRRHQIRYHLKHLSHPLLGDANYGQGRLNRFFRGTFALDRLFLHAEHLRLLHPVEDRQLELSSPLPEGLRRVLECLAGYTGPVI
jgi:tRNA pseudouridine65 synthase